MNEAQQNLAQRLIEHPAWRWMPGMLCTEGYRWGWSHTDREVATTVDDGEGGAMMRYPYCDAGLPDLTDPATVGCLLPLAREAWGDPNASCEHRHITSRMSGWTVRVEQRCTEIVRVSSRSPLEMFEATEGEALAHAILSAPTKETT